MSIKGITKKNNPDYEEKTGVNGQTYYKKKETASKAASLEQSDIQNVNDDFSASEYDDEYTQDQAYENMVDNIKNEFYELDHDNISFEINGMNASLDDLANEYAESVVFDGEKEVEFKLKADYSVGDRIIDDANNETIGTYSEDLPQRSVIDTDQHSITMVFSDMDEFKETYPKFQEVLELVRATRDESPILNDVDYSTAIDNAIDEAVNYHFGDLEDYADDEAENYRENYEREGLSEDQIEEKIEELRNKFLEEVNIETVTAYIQQNRDSYMESDGSIWISDNDKADIINSLR